MEAVGSQRLLPLGRPGGRKKKALALGSRRRRGCRSWRGGRGIGGSRGALLAGASSLIWASVFAAGHALHVLAAMLAWVLAVVMAAGAASGIHGRKLLGIKLAILIGIKTFQHFLAEVSLAWRGLLATALAAARGARSAGGRGWRGGGLGQHRQGGSPCQQRNHFHGHNRVRLERQSLAPIKEASIYHGQPGRSPRSFSAINSCR